MTLLSVLALTIRLGSIKVADSLFYIILLGGRKVAAVWMDVTGVGCASRDDM